MMSPVVRISDDVFAQLQAIAKPLVDTPNSIIERLLRERAEMLVRERDETEAERVVESDASIADRSHEHRGRRVILQPAASKEAQRHFKRTIRHGVELDLLERHLDPAVMRELRATTDGRVLIWGAVPGPMNKRNYAKIGPGDVVLFYKDKKYFAAYRVTIKLPGERKLAQELWGTDAEGRTWELVYVVERIGPIEVPVTKLHDIAGKGPRTLLRGLWVHDPTPSERILEELGL